MVQASLLPVSAGASTTTRTAPTRPAWRTKLLLRRQTRADLPL